MLDEDWGFEHENFRKVSEEYKDLLRKMLTLDPDNRISANSAVEHEWFKSDGQGNTSNGDIRS